MCHGGGGGGGGVSGGYRNCLKVFMNKNVPRPLAFYVCIVLKFNASFYLPSI